MYLLSENVLDENRALSPAALKISGSQISEVVRLRQNNIPEFKERHENVRDFGSAWITPAFINAHTHLPLAFIRGVSANAGRSGNMVENLFFRLENHLQPGDVKAFSRIGALESLHFGVGFVWDHYYAPDEVAAAMHEVGLAGAVACTAQDLKGPGVDRLETEISVLEELAGNSLTRDSSIFPVIGPHATDSVSDELFLRLLSLAEKHKLPIHLHVAQSIEEYSQSLEKHNESPVSRLSRLGILDHQYGCIMAHGYYVSDEDLKRVKKAGARFVMCPYSALLFGIPSRLDLWDEHGIDYAIATDCAASNNSMNVQKELRYVASQGVSGSGFSSSYTQFIKTGRLDDAQQAWDDRVSLAQSAQHRDLLSKVWETPGSWYPGQKLGKIEVGAMANLLVWDPKHPSMWPALDVQESLAMGDTSGAILERIVSGRAVVIDGQEQSAWTKEADERLNKLLSRAQISDG